LTAGVLVLECGDRVDSLIVKESNIAYGKA